jgi:hypothetical protein
MAYTPELTQHHSATLRRIAWAMQTPMTKALEDIFDYLGKTLDPGTHLFSLPGQNQVRRLPIQQERSP